jgi:hypothetical protein
MWPWGHVAVGFLLYVAYRRYRDGTPPTGPATIAVVFGTQLPDLVDKPLAWTVAVLPTGRSLAHSWLVAGVVLAVAWWALSGPRRALVVPLAVGWLSHGLADAAYSIVTGEFAYVAFLAWPLASTPPYDTEPSFVAHLLAFSLDPSMVVQTLLFVLAVVVWYRDGQPGVQTVLDTVGLAPETETR